MQLAVELRGGTVVHPHFCTPAGKKANSKLLGGSQACILKKIAKRFQVFGNVVIAEETGTSLGCPQINCAHQLRL